MTIAGIHMLLGSRCLALLFERWNALFCEKPVLYVWEFIYIFINTFSLLVVHFGMELSLALVRYFLFFFLFCCCWYLIMVVRNAGMYCILLCDFSFLFFSFCFCHYFESMFVLNRSHFIWSKTLLFGYTCLSSSVNNNW